MDRSSDASESGRAAPAAAVAEAQSFAEGFRGDGPGGGEPASSPQPPSTDAGEQKPQGKPRKERKTYQQVQMPSYEQMVQEDFMNNCAVRTGLSGIMGLGLGAMFGIAMGTFDAAGASAGLDTGIDVKPQTTRQVLREMLKTTSARSWHALYIASRSYAKGFGAMGALFAGSECVIEKARAKHDMYNSIYAGCVAGGAMAYSAGPKGMCLGCASFAAFSYMIDRFLDH